MLQDYTFERTTDYALIREILTHPKIWKRLADDFAGDPAEFEPSESSGYLLGKHDAEIVGLFAFFKENEICWAVHMAILPQWWGPRAKECALAGIEWVWTNTRCERLIGCVASSNRLALKFDQAIGFEVIGVNRKSVMRNGKLEDQVLLGISKPASTMGPRILSGGSTP